MSRLQDVVVPEAGGISPGAPFQLLHFTYVQQTAPNKLLATQRLAIVLDAVESIVAPSFGAGARTFVMGEGSDCGALTDQVILGYQVVNAQTSNKAVLIGGNIAPPNAGGGGEVYIGWDFTFFPPLMGGSLGLNVAIGKSLRLGPSGGAGVSGNANVAIGFNLDCFGSGNVVIGQGAICFDYQNVVIGDTALAAAGVTQAVVMGQGSKVSGVRSAVINGRDAGTRSSVVGWSTRAGDKCLLMGAQVDAAGRTSVICFADNFNPSTDKGAYFGSNDLPVEFFTFQGGARLQGALGVLWIQEAAAAPVGNPANGHYLWSDPTTGFLTARNPAGLDVAIA